MKRVFTKKDERTQIAEDLLLEFEDVFASSPFVDNMALKGFIIKVSYKTYDLKGLTKD
uniref:Uncharacterized protein n=1 Tax=viral metagenome TaxID=1070528 RepID=A0A6M3JEU4_9ZZZZ